MKSSNQEAIDVSNMTEDEFNDLVKKGIDAIKKAEGRWNRELFNNK